MTKTAEKLKCKHGCGYEHAHKGTMNLHESIHCSTLKKGSAKSPKRGPTPPAKKLELKCECEDGGSWRFLSPAVQLEANARAHGKKQICDTCEEVI